MCACRQDSESWLPRRTCVSGSKWTTDGKFHPSAPSSRGARMGKVGWNFSSGLTCFCRSVGRPLVVIFTVAENRDSYRYRSPTCVGWRGGFSMNCGGCWNCWCCYETCAKALVSEGRMLHDNSVGCVGPVQMVIRTGHSATVRLTRFVYLPRGDIGGPYRKGEPRMSDPKAEGFALWIGGLLG